MKAPLSFIEGKGNCMELSNLAWRKASYSADNGGHCIELATVPETVAIRDSKDPEGPKLLVNRDDFRRLTETIRAL
jgi:hypothetical protein